MAQTIKLKRSSVAGRVPTTSDLDLGEVAINTADGKMYIKKDTGGTESIIEIGSSGVTSSFTLYEYTATASQTTFSGVDSNSNTLAYDTGTPPKVQVFLNGVLLDFTTDYTATNGTSVSLTVGANAGDLLQVAAYKSVTVDSDIALGDNTKLLLGNDSDFWAYHDGSNTIFNQTGTGNLLIQKDETTVAEVTASGITLTGELDTDTVQFDTTGTGATAAGQISWNTDTGTLELGLNADVSLELGEQNYFQVKAGQAISKGDVVYASGAVGNSSKIIISKYIANGTIEEQRVLGIAAEDLALNDFGFVIAFGTLRGLQTDGQNLTTPETWNLGDILYASPSVAGELTKTLPVAPNQAIPIAFVTSVNSSAGSLAVRAYELGSHLGEIHDVYIASETDNDILQWSTANSRWENVAGTTTNIAEGTNLYWTTARGDSNFTTNLAASDTDDLSEGVTNLYWTTARGDSNFTTNLAASDTDDLSEGATNLYWTTARGDSNFTTNLAASDTDDLSEGATNLYYTDARFDTRLATKTTTDLTEGTNLYYTSARFDTAFSGKSTTDLSEGTNLYYTDARFDTRLGTKSTTDLAEGTNLYYTDARVGSYLTTNSYATESYVGTQIANLIDSAPAALDTLNELAAALGDDANFSTTVTNSIALKQDAATALTTSTTFGGDVSGTYNAIVVADDSHNHIISNVDGLQTALDGKVSDTGDTMTGTLTLPEIKGSGGEVVFSRSAITTTTSTGETRLFSWSGNEGFVEFTLTNADFYWHITANATDGILTVDSNYDGSSLQFDAVAVKYVSAEDRTYLVIVVYENTTWNYVIHSRTSKNVGSSLTNYTSTGSVGGVYISYSTAYIPSGTVYAHRTNESARFETLSVGSISGGSLLKTTTNFGGDVSGTYNAIVIADDSHNHVISNVDGLQTALDAKLPLAGGTVTGNLTLGSGSSTGVLALKTYDDAASEWHLYNYNDDTLRFNYNGSGGDEFILSSSGLLTISGGISDSGGITSTGTVQGANVRAQGTSPVVVINDSNGTNDTDTSAYVSFQTNGTERAYLGFGSAGNDIFRLSRSAGDIQLTPNLGNVDITTGGLEVGGVSVIDSSRGITGTGMSINSAGHAYLNINGASGYESGIIWKKASANKWETYVPNGSSNLQHYSYDLAGQVLTLQSSGVVDLPSGYLRILNTGTDQKIQFQRTGSDTISIEHDASQFYFWNRTDNHYTLKMTHEGLADARLGFQVNGVTVIDSGRDLKNIGVIEATSFRTKTNGVTYWGSASADYGHLTWDTGYAEVRALNSGELRLGSSYSGNVVAIDTAGYLESRGNGIKMSTRYLARPSNWGYSVGYRAIILGSESTTYTDTPSGSVTLSFNYDPSVNASGSFTGDGREIIFRNGTQFVTPNSANTGWNSYNLVLKDGHVGIGEGNPQNTLAIDSTYTNSVKINGTGSYSLYSYHDSAGVGWATGPGASYDTLIYMQGQNNYIRLYTGGDERLRVQDTGANIISGGLLINGTEVISSARDITSINIANITQARLSSYRLNDRYAAITLATPYFTNGVSNQAVDITLGNTYLNAEIQIEVTGGYSYQNVSGVIRRKWQLGFNANGSIWQTPTIIDETMEGPIASVLYVSDPFWDSGASTYKIRIYKANSYGNNFQVRLTNFSVDAAGNFLDNVSMGSLLTNTTTNSSHTVGYNSRSGYLVGGTTVIDASTVITAEGASGGKNLVYASNFAASGAGIQLTLERTGNAIGWGGIGADADYCFGAWGGSGGVQRNFAIGQSGNANLLYGGYQINSTTVIDSGRNLTNIGYGLFNGYIRVENSNAAFSALDLGSSTQSSYTNIIIRSNSGDAQLWKQGTTTDSWGGASALNIYNSNGIITFHPQGTGNVLQIDSGGPNIGGTKTLRHGGTTVLDASRNLTNLGSVYADGDIVVNNNGSGNYYLYLKKAVGGDGHLLFQDGSSLKWQNTSSSSTSDLNWYSYTAAATVFGIRANGGVDSKANGYYVNGTQIVDGSRNLTNIGTATMSKLNLHAAAYQGVLTFGSNGDWRCGISQYDNQDAEMRIWHRNANGMIFLTTGYDGEAAALSRPTAGLVVQANNVGIGNFSNSDPANYLHVKGTGDAQLTLDGDGTSWSGIRFQDVSGGNYIWMWGATSTWAFGGGGSSGVSGKRVHIDGGCTIGDTYDSTTMPTNGLQVLGEIYADKGIRVTYTGDTSTDAGVYINNTSSDWGLKVDKASYEYGISNNVVDTANNAYLQYGSSVAKIRFDGAGNGIFAGNVTAYGSPSDIRLKENVERIPDAVEKVKKLDGITFDYKEGGGRSTGLIAQQLLEVLPEVVYTQKGADGEGEERYAVRYGNVVGLLVEAIKEQQTQIEILQTQLEELKALSKEN